MSTTSKKWYIKKRDNPQLPTYYVAEGQLLKKEAKKKENTLYGSNVMLIFDSEEEYKSKIKDLEEHGYRVIY